MAARSARGVRPPAEAAAGLAKLEREWAKVPEELQVFFSAHGGQDPTLSIFPGVDERHLLSVEKALEARSFLRQEYPERYSPEWLPLLANRGGDYLVYMPDGDGPGSVAAFYHDDPELGHEPGGIPGLIAGWEAALDEEKAQAEAFGSLPATLEELKDGSLGVMATTAPVPDLLMELRKLTSLPLAELKAALTKPGLFLQSVEVAGLASLQQRSEAWLSLRKTINLLKKRGIPHQVVLTRNPKGGEVSRQELEPAQTERIFEILRS